MALSEVVLVIIRRSDGSGLTFDAVVDEQHAGAAVVTDYPVERGVNVADHVRQAPRRLTLNGIVGPAPLYLSEGFPFFAGEGERVQRAFEELESLQDDSEILEVVTRNKAYKNMVMISSTAVKNKSSSSILSANCVLQQIRAVSSQQIDLPTPVSPRGEASSKDGRRVGETVAKPDDSSLALDAARQLARATNSGRLLDLLGTGGR